MLRFGIPIIIVICIEISAGILTFEDKFDLIGFLFNGGTGPGSYYFPIMVQLIFYFPLLFAIIKANSRFVGLSICFLINLVFEIWTLIVGLDVSVYRLLIFRYTFLISCGVYFYFENKKIVFNIKTVCCLLASMTVGALYIITTSYSNYSEVIFNKWATTSMIVAFWIFPLFCFGYIACRKLSSSVFQIVGKASYHIFLVQMVFYCTSLPRLIEDFSESKIIAAAINIVTCVVCGIIFYILESYATDKLLHLSRYILNKVKKT